MRADAFHATPANLGWSATCLAAALWLASTGAADCQDAPAAPPSRISLTGSVVNAASKPVADARVVLVAPMPTIKYQPWRVNVVPCDSVATSTTTSGEFRLSFESTDDRFLRAGDFELFVFHPDYAIHVQQLRMARLQVDLPIAISLDAARPIRVQVIDSSGKPVASASVSLAQQADILVPQPVSSVGAAVTSADGWATLTNVASDRLQAVFVESDTVGRQKLAVTTLREDEFQARTMPVTSLRARFTTADGQSLAALAGTKVFVASRLRGHESDTFADYSWAVATVDRDGRFGVNHLSEGSVSRLVDYPSAFPLRPNFDERPFRISSSEPAEWSVLLNPAGKVTGKILDQGSGCPAAHIYLDTFSDELKWTFSDTTGAFQFWLPRGSPRFYLPMSALGHYVLPSSAYKRAIAPADAEILSLEPLYLQPAAPFVGRVVDEDGQPIVGAAIECQRQLENYWVPIHAYSDSSGVFTVHGTATGDAVRLSARQGDLATERPVGVTVGADRELTLALSRRQPGRLVGRVLDQNSAPMPLATVVARKAVDIREASIGPEVLQIEDLAPAGSIVQTDATGRFEFPTSTAWRQRLRIEITAPRCIHYVSPWFDGKSLKLVGDRVDLGNFRVTKSPEGCSVEVRVVDEPSGQAVPDAQVVLIGARTGKASGITGRDGKLRLDCHEGLQILGVEKDGYQHLFRVIKTLDNLGTLQLQPMDSAPPLGHDSIRRFTSDYLRGVSKTLLDELTDPAVGGNTLSYARWYFRALSTVAPREVYTRLASPQTDYAQRSLLLSSCIYNIIETDPLIAEQMIRANTDRESRYGTWRDLARQTTDPEARSEFLSEALIAARQSGGDDYLFAMGSVAWTMWKLGYRDEARSALREAWKTSSDLQQIVIQKEHMTRVGVSRAFATSYALVDPETALKLIQLIADESEIKGLQTEALLVTAESDPDRFRQLVDKLGSARLSPVWWERFVQDHGCRAPELVASLAGHLPNSVEKARILARLSGELAHSSPARAREVFASAMETLRNLDLSSTDDHFLSHPSGAAADLIQFAYKANPQLVPAVVFTAMWLWSNTPINEHGFALVSDVAAGIARYDPELARALIQPCFDDWSWFHETDVKYFACGPLKAAARIDPPWAIDLAKGVLSTNLQGLDGSRAEVVAGTMNAFHEMIVELQHR